MSGISGLSGAARTVIAAQKSAEGIVCAGAAPRSGGFKSHWRSGKGVISKGGGNASPAGVC